MEPLTKREAEIAQLMVAGYSRKGIAKKLNLQPRTVDTHVQNAAAKLPGTGGAKLKLVLFALGAMRSRPAKKRSA